MGYHISKNRSTLRWRHNDHAGVSNHQPPGCLLNRLFRRKSKKTSKLRVTGLCAGNSPGTGEFSAQMASYAENVSIWWRHHDFVISKMIFDISKNNFSCRKLDTSENEFSISEIQRLLFWTFMGLGNKCCGIWINKTEAAELEKIEELWSLPAES